MRAVFLGAKLRAQYLVVDEDGNRIEGETGIREAVVEIARLDTAKFTQSGDDFLDTLKKLNEELANAASGDQSQ